MPWFLETQQTFHLILAELWKVCVSPTFVVSILLARRQFKIS